MGPSLKSGDKKRSASFSNPEKSDQPAKKKPPKPQKEVAEAAPVAAGKAQEQGGAKRGKKKSEIDDIFGVGSSAKASEEGSCAEPAVEGMSDELKELANKIKQARASKGGSEVPSSKHPKVHGSKDDIFGADDGKRRKRTEEGYPIYSEAELGLNKKGGDTDLCPFDCDCCF